MVTNISSEIICRICHSMGRSYNTGLRTCEDIRNLGDYAVYRCMECGNGFTMPDISSVMYKLLPDVPNEELTSCASMMLRWFVERRFKKLSSVLKNRNAALLDIGGGACAFANAAAHYGYAVTVIEPNKENKKFADVSHGVNFIPEMFSNDLIQRGVLKPNSFDAVTMWHSLEHTSNPEEVLQTIYTIMKPGGVMLISVPNLSGLLAKVGGNYWTYLDVPHHLCHFTPHGLKRLAENTGFIFYRSYRFSIEYDAFGWYQTLLNVMGRSHNYFYNSRKKRRGDEAYLRYPLWTKFVTAIGPLLLPIIGIMSVITILVNSPACIEIAVRREIQ